MGTLLSNGQASKVNAYKSKYQLLAILYLTGSNRANSRHWKG